MKKVLYFFFVLFIFSVSVSAQTLFLFHDTTAVPVKRMADRDTLKTALSKLFSSSTITYFNQTTVLSGLSAYKSIVLVETSFDNSMLLSAGSRDSLKAWMNSGTAGNKKALINIGGDQGYNYSRSTATSIDTALCHGLWKFSYIQDNGSVTGSPSITGVGIDAGQVRLMSATPVGGGYYPDGVHPLAGTVLYSYTTRGSDTVASVGYNSTGYVVASLLADPRYFTGDFSTVLKKLIDYAVANGGLFQSYLPVELTSFTAFYVNNVVSLKWTTATEINNRGFSIQRKTASGEFQEIAFIKGKGTTTEQSFYTLSDKEVKPGKYTYRLKQVDFDGTSSLSNGVEVEVTAPKVYSLEQNYPNPFNPSTSIKYSVPNDGLVNLTIFNALGQKVAVLVNSQMSSGTYEVNFNAANFTSGVYFYRIEAGSFVSTKKMLLIK